MTDTPTPAFPVRQPVPVRVINTLGDYLQQLGLAGPKLDTGALIRSAGKKTGLDDFGDATYEEGLQILVAALNDQAHLSQIGRIAALLNIRDLLCKRLLLVDYRNRHPALEKQKIKKPLIITGLPRTGTTILHELITQDPNFSFPASWEVTSPLPPVELDTPEQDKRIRRTDRAFALLDKLSPNFNAIHAIGARLPQECVYILASHFASEQFGYMYNIPEYRSWLLGHDMTQAYQWHAGFLQQLQSNSPRERWVLKAPGHLPHLKYMLAQYPDATVIWTHRQPLDAMSSFSSLASRLRSAFSNAIDPLAAGMEQITHYAHSVQAGMEQRAQLNEDQFVDIGFSQLCNDPISAIATIYQQMGIHFSPEAEQRMNSYLAQHPRHLYGEHRYSSEAFGLTKTLESQLYASYQVRFSDFLH